MQKQKLRNNKIKRAKTKNMPIFILVSLIIVIIIIALIYYIFLRYAPEKILTYNGYAVEGRKMTESLKGDAEKAENYLSLVEVHEDDLLYRRSNLYYVGDNEKVEIDINYPIFVNESNALLNLGENTKLITVNYEEVEGYPEFFIAGRVMYNENNLTRADGNEYIFLKSQDEIFTNIEKINIATLANNYEINEYSNIYFTENYITYYEMFDGYMKYNRIRDIDENTEIEINGEKIKYSEFLERIGIIETENINTNNEVENTIVENTVNEETEINEENKNEETIEIDQPQKEWIKPEVSITEFEAYVYTIKTNITVNDTQGDITRGIIFEIILDGRVVRRVDATGLEELEISSLQPETEYQIRGTFYYNDENGIERLEEFYNGTVTTKSIDILEPIDISFENGEIYSNKIEVKNLKINNDINEESVKGIYRIQLEIDGAEYRIENDKVVEIKSGNAITYSTREVLQSNSKIKYEIKIFDKYGNELKVINNKGETITSKQLPTATVRMTRQNIIEVDISVELTNKDDVVIENYRYEIINQENTVVKEGSLENEKEDLTFSNLDPNGYYQMIIYGDLDLEDSSNNKLLNQEIGRGSFVTMPIASLGYIHINIDQKKITQNEAELEISINENGTDARLISILSKVDIVIYDKGKNTEDNQESEEIQIKNITLTQEELEQLKQNEKIKLNLDKLISNTKYRIDVKTTIKQGSVEEIVEDRQNIEEIITLKVPTEVQIKNMFITENLLDFDIRVEDLDGAVLVDKVRIEIRDEENKLISLEEMNTNGDFERKIFENLEENKTYQILVYAPQYNEGSTNETYHADYILKELEIYTEEGVSGSIDILSLEKEGTGKNLIDVSSKVNWFRDCFDLLDTETYGLEYNEDTKILSIGESNNTGVQYLYNLNKYIGEEVTISFRGRTNKENSKVYLINNKEKINEINLNTSEYSNYLYTFIIGEDGYIGFEIEDGDTKLEIQDLQVELGNQQTSYEEFKYVLKLNTVINVKDLRNEIDTNDYYVRIYKDDEQIAEYQYVEFGEDNIIENALKSYEVETDGNYRVELLINIEGRFYTLDYKEADLNRQNEIYGIENLDELYKIQPNGNYVVLNDIEISSTKKTFGNENVQYNGTLNFNGKTITSETEDMKSFFEYIGENGYLENLVLNMKVNEDQNIGELVEEARVVTGFINTNNGVIKNVNLNIVECSYTKHTKVELFISTNNGSLENFVINYRVPVYVFADFSLIGDNSGNIKNGYIYGENIEAPFTAPKITTHYAGTGGSGTRIDNTDYDIVVLLKENSNFGVVQNIYSLVNINIHANHDVDNEVVSNIVLVNGGFATIQNLYSWGLGSGINGRDSGPSVYTVTSTNINEVYYINDEVFDNEFNKKGNKLNLWNIDFQETILNSEGQFEINRLIDNGYYPQVILSNVMPSQEYIPLPDVSDEDLLDILTTRNIRK